MPEIGLHSAGVVAIICQLVAAGVPQHVRMHRERQTAFRAAAVDQPPDTNRRHRCLEFAPEDVTTFGMLTAKAAQRPQPVADNRVHRGLAILHPVDVHVASVEIDLVPGQGAQFADVQTMPVGDEDQCRVAVAVSATLVRGLTQATYKSAGSETRTLGYYRSSRKLARPGMRVESTARLY